MFLRGPGTAPRVVPMPSGKSRAEDMQQLIDETGERRGGGCWRPGRLGAKGASARHVHVGVLADSLLA